MERKANALKRKTRTPRLMSWNSQPYGLGDLDLILGNLGLLPFGLKREREMPLLCVLYSPSLVGGTGSG